MKKLFVLLVTFLISTAAYSQVINSFYGLNFGASKEECIKVLEERGFSILVDGSSLFMDNSNLTNSSRSVKYERFVLRFSDDNQLLSIDVVLVPDRVVDLENYVQEFVDYYDLPSDSYQRDVQIGKAYYFLLSSKNPRYHFFLIQLADRYELDLYNDLFIKKDSYFE